MLRSTRTWYTDKRRRVVERGYSKSFWLRSRRVQRLEQLLLLESSRSIPAWYEQSIWWGIGTSCEGERGWTLGRSKISSITHRIALQGRPDLATLPWFSYLWTVQGRSHTRLRTTAYHWRAYLWWLLRYLPNIHRMHRSLRLTAKPMDQTTLSPEPRQHFKICSEVSNLLFEARLFLMLADNCHFPLPTAGMDSSPECM